jgi:hypothetical protein
MPLSRMRALVSLLCLAVACTRPSEPGAFTARFELSDINGRSLPTYPVATPGLTPTILSSTIVFDQTGVATITEHRTEFNGADATIVTNYTYHVSGDEVIFEPGNPCPPNANCIPAPKGPSLRIDSHLKLVGSIRL